MFSKTSVPLVTNKRLLPAGRPRVSAEGDGAAGGGAEEAGAGGGAAVHR